MQTRTFTRARVLSLVLGGTLVLAACGGGDDGATADAPATSAEASTTTTVTMRDNEYAPSDLVVGSGELELVNEG